ncbi:hypothetical protein AAC387_Pa06g0472 [Persea americana]
METQGSESDLYGIMKSTGSHNKLSAGAQLRGSISHGTFKVQILNSDTKDGLKFVPHCFSSGTNEMGEGFKLTKHYLHSSITWLERGTEGRRHLLYRDIQPSLENALCGVSKGNFEAL